MRAFLLFLVGCSIPINKSNKHIDLIWLDGQQDFARIRDWSWGRTTLTNLYYQLSEATDPDTSSIGGYMSLLKLVIYFVFMLLVYHIIIC